MKTSARHKVLVSDNLASTRVVPPAPPSSASSTTTFSQVQTPQMSHRVDPALEPVYEEKAYLLGFRKPMTPHPLSRLSSKEFFRAILEHAADCEFQECRLDSRE